MTKKGGHQKTQAVVSTTPIKSVNPSVKKVLKIVLLVVVAGLLVWAGAMLYKHQTQPKPTACQTAQGQQLLKKASPNLVSQNVAKLAPTVRSIQALPGYDKDSNCLYVVTTYYINISDAKTAQLNYTKLAAVYDKNKGYSSSLGAHKLTPTELKPVIDFLVENSKVKPLGQGGS